MKKEIAYWNKMIRERAGNGCKECKEIVEITNELKRRKENALQ